MPGELPPQTLFPVKPFLLSLLCYFLASGIAIAQVDAKVNAGSLIFGGLGASAEIALNENVGISPGLAFTRTDLSVSFGEDGERNDYRLDNLRFIPEARYYFGPRQGTDRFFAGLYGKYGRQSFESRNGEEDYSFSRAAIGVLTGMKWVTDGGFVFELNAGIGRATTFGGDDNGEVTTVINALTGIDARFGIIAGYRF